MNVSSTLFSKTIKQDFIEKNIPFFDGGLGENPLPQPQVLIDTVKKYSSRKEYTDAKGIKELREYLGDKVIVGNGLKPLIFLLQLAFSKLYPNGIIYHIVPYWVSYSEQTNILSLNTKKIVPDDKINFKITTQDLINNLDKDIPHLIIFNNPNNPSGCLYTKTEIQQLSVVFKNYNSIVFCDDIYEHIVHNDKLSEFGQLKNYYNKVIIGSSLSKLVACGGYRLGWLSFKSDELNALHNLCNILASSIYSCPSIMFQYVALKTLEMGQEITKFLTFQRNMFTKIKQYIIDRLKNTNLLFSDSAASWYILLNFDNYKDKLIKINIVSADDLFKYLLKKHKIIMVSGENFGINDSLILRYSYIDISNIDVSKQKFNFKRIVELFDVLLNWLDNLN